MRYVPTSRAPSTSKLDLGGALLSMIGLGLLVWALIEAPARGWTDGLIVGAFTVSLVVLAGFVGYELRAAAHVGRAVLPQRPVHRRQRLDHVPVLRPQRLHLRGGAVPAERAGLHGPAGRYSDAAVRRRRDAARRRLPGRRPLAGDEVVVAGGIGLFTVGLAVAAATFGVDTGYRVFLTMLVIGAGMGLAMAPATESVMGSLPKEKAGVGSAISDTTRELGGTLGVAVGGSALAAVYASELSTAPGAAAHPHRSRRRRPDSIGGAFAVADGAGAFAEPLRAAAREAFVQGLRADVLISAGVALVAVVVALVFLPSRATEHDRPSHPYPTRPTGLPHHPSRRRTGADMNRKLTAAMLITAAVLSMAAFTALGSVFNYPDVLKDPPGDVLAEFRASQGAVSGWFAVLAAAAALFAPIAIGVGRLSPARAMRIAVPVGMAAAAVQVIGLLRWPLLVPGYAADAASSDPGVASRARDAFDTANQILGTAIGESFGYVLTAAWTLLVIAALRRSLAGRWFSVLGSVSALLVLAGVLSPLELPLVDTANFAGYVLWSLWLVAFAVLLLVRLPRSAPSYIPAVAGDLAGAST